MGVPTNTNIEVLKGVVLESVDNELILTTHDLKSNIIYKIPCQTDTEGKTLIECKMLKSIITKLSNDDILLESKDNKLTVKSGTSRFNIPIMDIDEYPDNLVCGSDNEFNLDIDDIKTILKTNIISASDEEERVLLNSLYLDFDGNYLNFVCADGYRLSLNRIPFVTDKSQKIIVPINIIKTLNHVFGTIKTGDIRFQTDDDYITITIDDITITSRLIKGQFPNYNLLIPKESNTTIEVDSKYLLDICERINIIASTNARLVKLNIKEREISSVSPDTGEVREKIDMGVTGEGLDIVFNVKMLMDVLKITDGTVKIDFTDDVKPILVTDGIYKYIFMPIKVKS